jgi:hypothetical protein
MQERVNEDIWQIVTNIEQTIHIMFDQAGQTKDSELERFVDDQYKSLLQELVWQMSSLPTDREELGLEPMSDPHDIAVAYSEILDMLTAAFGFTRKRIENDLQTFMKKYTPDDIREVRKLKRENRLN